MKSPTKKPKPGDKKAVEAPDIERHDEVYFRHASGPMVGRVLARGEHGCTIEADGKRHKVKWDSYLGHKVRVRQEVKVVDQGDDGMLVEDRSGRRRFIRDSMDQPAEEPGLTKPVTMAKALPTPVVLFTNATPADLVKAMGGGKRVAGGAGLSLQVVTDKGGHQTKRWKKTGTDQPGEKRHAAAEDGGKVQHGQHNVKNGDRVSFKMGTLSGKGQVVASGAKGATVKDAEGHPHKVTWDQIAEHASGGREDRHETPEAQSEAKSKDAKAKAKAKPGAGDGLFDPSDVASLPRRTAQPVKSWDELVTKATEGLVQYKEALGKVADTLGLKTDAKPADLEGDAAAGGEGYLFVGSLKGEQRAKQKVESEYDGDYSQLRDMVRATIAVSSMDEIRAAVAAVEAAGLTLAQKPNDRFANPTPEGYRDLNTVVKLPNGMVAELQYHLKPITAAKAEGHADYEISRTLQAKYGENAPSDAWSDEDHGEFHRAVQRQRQIYDAAWKKAQGEVDNG